MTIHRGEVVGLIGPNGAGKTTLFECLAKVLPRDRGDVSAPSLFYMPDGIAPWASETVGWSLRLALGLYGGGAERLDAVVRDLDMAPFLNQPIGALSKGQRKRATLAIALLAPHELLLVDEPFDGLDLRQSREVAAVLRREAARGRTLFLSIHQISEAGRVCDRFVLLSNGRVRGQGTLDELRQAVAVEPSASLEEVFLALT